jgi:hypothetical protein
MPFPFRSLLAVAAVSLSTLLGGCATISDSPVQQLELHAVLDHREIGGVGCILSNDNGRWYVIAPGRVTVTRSAQPLSVSCKKEGTAVAAEVVQARLDTNNLIGNVVISAGLGYFVDRHSGAGYGYPAVLTVLMQPGRQAQEGQAPAGENAVATRMF